MVVLNGVGAELPLQDEEGTGILNATERGILDLLSVKSWAIKLATDAVLTVLSVDQIIVARQAGGESNLENGRRVLLTT